MTPEELDALRLSAVVAVSATVISAPFAIATGLFLARWTHPFRTVIEAAVMAPLVVPPVVTGWVLLWLLGPLHLSFSTPAAVIASAVVSFPLFVRAIRLSVDAVDPGLEEAARSLGASRWRTWRTITLPLAWPGIVTGAVLAFARALGEFGATITFAGNVAGETRTIPLAIYRFTQMPSGDGAASRLAVLALLLALGAMVVSEMLARRQR